MAGRSRNYPAIGLGEAVEKARQLYALEGKAVVPSDVAVQAWGYSGLNGASLRMLAALRQYDLLDSPSPKNVRLTNLALTILLEPEDSSERAGAIRAASQAPAMFTEIEQQYPDNLPSDATLVSWLVRSHNFVESAAKGLIAAYRGTLDLVKDEAGGHITAGPSNDDVGPPAGFLPAPRDRQPVGDPPRGNSPRPIGGEVMEFTWALSANASATLSVSKQLDADDIETLEDGFKMAIKAVRKAVRQNQSASDAGSEAD